MYAMARRSKVKVLVGIAVVCGMAAPAIAQTTTAPPIPQRQDPAVAAQYDGFPRFADDDRNIPKPHSAIGVMSIPFGDATHADLCSATVVNSFYGSMIVSGEHCFSPVNAKTASDFAAHPEYATLLPVFAPAPNRRVPDNVGRLSSMGPFGDFVVALVQRGPNFGAEVKNVPGQGDVTFVPQDLTIGSTASEVRNDFSISLVCPKRGKRVQDLVGGIAFAVNGRNRFLSSVSTMISYPRQFGTGAGFPVFPLLQVAHAGLRPYESLNFELPGVGDYQKGPGASGSPIIEAYAPGTIRTTNVLVGVNSVQAGSSSIGSSISARFMAAYLYMSKIDPATLPQCDPTSPLYQTVSYDPMRNENGQLVFDVRHLPGVGN
jgi:hypothetical protein